MTDNTISNSEQMDMWQSWVEIKYYSVTYFECITELDAL